MKRVSSDFHQFHTVNDEAKAKLKYQTLANEFLELQKEFVSKKRKLKAAKQKRDTFFAEVRFLRQRQKYLYRIKHSNKGEDLLRLPNSDEEINIAEGERNLSAYEAAPGKSNSKTEEVGGQNQVLEKERRFASRLKNGLIHGKAVDERKISRHDQFTFQIQEGSYVMNKSAAIMIRFLLVSTSFALSTDDDFSSAYVTADVGFGSVRTFSDDKDLSSVDVHAGAKHLKSTFFADYRKLILLHMKINVTKPVNQR
ncbi:Hypothetical predicted protein [Olea europaea subsp. europaea]|uniref:Uncharacterized protein n=1 Tax=Olea europaea subsp. europaea TaxID=158383 RepID=A0A8S0UN61_OLEEU|nr:Hypothetical predicted protein [Olea europaea subsp. europaea]